MHGLISSNEKGFMLNYSFIFSFIWIMLFLGIIFIICAGISQDLLKDMIQNSDWIQSPHQIKEIWTNQALKEREEFKLIQAIKSPNDLTKLEITSLIVATNQRQLRI